MFVPLVSQFRTKGIGLMHDPLSHVGEIANKDALGNLCVRYKCHPMLQLNPVGHIATASSVHGLHVAEHDETW